MVMMHRLVCRLAGLYSFRCKTFITGANTLTIGVVDVARRRILMVIKELHTEVSSKYNRI
eukprot:scaffold452875_cov18-Prasinocladus_malaysianus.AAC.1